MGAWIETERVNQRTLQDLCRTRMGAWIETGDGKTACFRLRVAPVWVRGLKHMMSYGTNGKRSRTRMGAWIETPYPNALKTSRGVAPVWVRGLKQRLSLNGKSGRQSHPYGCVD